MCVWMCVAVGVVALLGVCDTFCLDWCGVVCCAVVFFEEVRFLWVGWSENNRGGYCLRY